VIEREAPGISASPRTAALPRLLRLIAARHAGALNVSDLAADAPLPRTSVLRYLDTLKALFLIVRIPAWSANLSQREIRAPKVYLTDPGLAGYLRRAEVTALLRPEFARYRDQDTEEIDIIVESPDGRSRPLRSKPAQAPRRRRCATWPRCTTASAANHSGHTGTGRGGCPGRAEPATHRATARDETAGGHRKNTGPAPPRQPRRGHSPR
jgi:uncharacterized protein DUF4143/IclR-like helix-turn-helix domain-containing protein